MFFPRREAGWPFRPSTSVPLRRANCDYPTTAVEALDKWERFRFVPAETGVDLGDADPRRQYVK